jgi:tripartite-type tricarboxylate transporter receptor subunit TctC
MKRLITEAVMIGFLCLAVSPATGQTYPARIIRIIVPFTPGGLTDVVARIAADYLAKRTGQSVIVENRPGAAGNLGSDAVAKSDPDGYTLLAASNSTMAMNPFLYKQMPFHPLNDFAPIAALGSAPQLLVVNPSLGPKTLQQLIALAKLRPGKISYGSAGAGSTPHLGADRFARLAGIELLHVPYRGMGNAIADVVAGHVDIMSAGGGPVIGFIESGKLRALAVADKTRASYLPDVPTAAEAGLPGYEMTSWFALVAPKATSKDAVGTLNGLINSMYNDPTSRARLGNNFLTAMPLTPEQLAELFHSDYKMWGQIISEAGLKAE